MRKLNITTTQNLKIFNSKINKSSNDLFSIKKDKKFTIKLEKLDLSMINQVGGKNASLGTMIKHLKPLGVQIPNGFAVTVHSYLKFIMYNKLESKIARLIDNIVINDIHSLKESGETIRNLISQGNWPLNLKEEIIKSYIDLSNQYNSNDIDVAVRSSATCEDLPEASFAG